MPDGHDPSPHQLVNRLVGYLFGAVYLLVGVVGFAITAGVGFAHTHGKELIIFELNPLHNVVHIAIGLLLGLAAYRGASTAAAANSVVGGVYLLVGVLGLFLTNSAANILAINHPDNALHLASALLLLGVGLSRK
jgi:hypothetical protein